MTIGILLFFGYNLIRIETHAFISASDFPPRGSAATNLETGRPDIYYIILDAYGRQDALEEFYGYDNSEFINFLRSKGFFVASQSQANYLTTELSLASSLNMSYLQPLSTASRLTRASVLKRLISENQARSILKSHGYQFVSFSTPFSFTNITDADLFLSLNKDRARETYLEAQILPGSVASIPLWAGKISPGGATFRDEQERIHYIFDELGRLSEIPGPKFIFAHIIAPHPPFMFDQNGPVTPDKPYVQGFQAKDEEWQTMSRSCHTQTALWKRLSKRYWKIRPPLR